MSILQALMAAIPILLSLAIVVFFIILFNKVNRIEKKLEVLFEENSNSSIH